MYASFLKKRVFGRYVYYPMDRTAVLLVSFKRAAIQRNRKRFIKCLSENEMKILKRTGLNINLELELPKKEAK